jgi:phosphatidylserine decarboxylase
MYIREEGFPFAAPPALAAVVLGALGYPLWAVLPAAASLAVGAFFRDPERIGPPAKDLLVSPADGKIIQTKALVDGRILISVFMNVHNVHVNRAPCAGSTASVAYNPGKFMAAWSEKASLDNEQVRILFDTPRGTVEVVQIAGLVARRIVCWARCGRVFQRGERIGLIRFGSRVDLYLPGAEVEVLVRLDEKVKAGATPLARWRSLP